MKKLEYRSNPSLETIRPGYRGNPVVEGRFVNELKQHKITFFHLAKWGLSVNPQGREKREDEYTPPRKAFPGAYPEGDFFVWLGHASFLLRLCGKTFLLDPCLFDIPFRKRRFPAPLTVEEIGPVDHICISHSHYDHLDEKSLKALDLSGAAALLPLGMGPSVKKINGAVNVEEAGWYQRYAACKEPEVYFLPSQHWSKRHLGDTNRVLWGGYCFKWRGQTLFFTGDSAYAAHFSLIQELLGAMDYCLMPIGAYKPDYLMNQSHMTPEESVAAFHDLEGKFFVPMHYGTYDLSDEPFGEPVRLIQKMEGRGEIKGQTLVPAAGEIVSI